MDIKSAIVGIVLGIVALIAINHFENKYLPKYVETHETNIAWEAAIVASPDTLNWGK